MNKSELTEFIDYLTSALPELGARLNNHSVQNPQLVEIWQRAFGKTALANAKRAVDAVLAAELDCRFVDQIPGAINGWCRENPIRRRVTIENEPEHNSPPCCGGFKFVSVLHPNYVRAILRDPATALIRTTYRKASARCECFNPEPSTLERLNKRTGKALKYAGQVGEPFCIPYTENHQLACEMVVIDKERVHKLRATSSLPDF